MEIRIIPNVIDAYRREIDNSVDDRGARVALEHAILEHLARRAKGVIPGGHTRGSDGAERWRVGPHKVRLHVYEHAAMLNVVRLERPHADWTPIAREHAGLRGGTLPHDLLGGRMGHARERLGHTVEVLAELAGVDVELVRQLERCEGIPDDALSAICDVLEVDVVVQPRLH